MTLAILLSQAFVAVLPWIGLLGILLVLSAFFSGSESALFSLDRYELEKLEESGRAGEAATRLLDEPRKLLATILLGNEVVNICVSVVGVRLLLELGERGLDVPWWANIVVVTPLLLLFGEIAPKAIAVRLGSTWARVVALPLRAFGVFVTPVRAVLHGLANTLLRAFGAEQNDPLPAALQEAQFRALVKLGESQGVLESDEAELIHAVFDLGDTAVSKLMTPRGDVISIALDSSIDQILETVRQFRYSRLPVYGDGPDDLRGTLLTKDLLRLRWSGEELNARRLSGVLKPPYFVPPGKKAAELLREFQRERGHLAVVIDEYGDMQGIVTLQDILDELFAGFAGEPVGAAPIGGGLERQPDGSYRVPPRCEIATWNQTLEPTLPTGATYTTVAGYIFHLFGRLPRSGDVVSDDHWTFQVVGVEGTRMTGFVATRGGPR